MDNSYYTRMYRGGRRSSTETYTSSSETNSESSDYEYRITKRFDDIRNYSSSTSSDESSDCSSSSYEYSWREAKKRSKDYEYVWTEAKAVIPSITAIPCTVDINGTKLPAVKGSRYTLVPLKAVLVILFPNNTPDDLEEGLRILDIHQLTKSEAEKLTEFVKSLHEIGTRSFTVGEEIYVASFSAGEPACEHNSLKAKYTSILDTLVITATDSIKGCDSAIKTSHKPMSKDEEKSVLLKRGNRTKLKKNSLNRENGEASPRTEMTDERTSQESEDTSDSPNSEASDSVCLIRHKIRNKRAEENRNSQKNGLLEIKAAYTPQKQKEVVVLKHLFPENEDVESESDAIASSHLDDEKDLKTCKTSTEKQDDDVKSQGRDKKETCKTSREKQDHYVKGQVRDEKETCKTSREKQDHYVKGQVRDEKETCKTSREKQDHYVKGQVRDEKETCKTSREKQDHYVKGQVRDEKETCKTSTEKQDHYVKGQVRDEKETCKTSREKQDHYVKGQVRDEKETCKTSREKQDHYVKGQVRDEKETCKTSTEKQDHYVKGQVRDEKKTCKTSTEKQDHNLEDQVGEEDMDTWTSLLLRHKNSSQCSSDLVTDVSTLSVKDDKAVIKNKYTDKKKLTKKNILKCDAESTQSRKSKMVKEKSALKNTSNDHNLKLLSSEKECEMENSGVHEVAKELPIKHFMDNDIAASVCGVKIGFTFNKTLKTITTMNEAFMDNEITNNKNASCTQTNNTSETFTSSDWKVTDSYTCDSPEGGKNVETDSHKSSHSEKSMVRTPVRTCRELSENSEQIPPDPPRKSKSPKRQTVKRECVEKFRSERSGKKSDRSDRDSKKSAKSGKDANRSSYKEEIHSPKKSTSYSRHEHKKEFSRERDSTEGRKWRTFERYGGYGQSNNYYRKTQRIVQRTPRFAPNYARLRFVYDPSLYSPLSSSETDFGDEEEEEVTEGKPKHKVLRRRSSRDNSRYRSQNRNSGSAERSSDRNFKSTRSPPRRIPNCVIRREFSPESDKKNETILPVGVQNIDAVIPCNSKDIENLVTAIRKKCDNDDFAFLNREHSRPSFRQRQSRNVRRPQPRRRSHSPSCAPGFTPSPPRLRKMKNFRRRSLSPVSRIERSPYFKLETAMADIEYMRNTFQDNIQYPTTGLYTTSPFTPFNSVNAFSEFERVWNVGKAGNNGTDSLNVEQRESYLPRTAETTRSKIDRHFINGAVSLSSELKRSDNSPFTPIASQFSFNGTQQAVPVCSLYSFQQREQTGSSFLVGEFENMRVRELTDSNKYTDGEVIILKGGHRYLEDSSEEMWPFLTGNTNQESSLDDNCDSEVENLMFSRLSGLRRKKTEVVKRNDFMKPQTSEYANSLKVSDKQSIASHLVSTSCNVETVLTTLAESQAVQPSIVTRKYGENGDSIDSPHIEPRTKIDISVNTLPSAKMTVSASDTITAQGTGNSFSRSVSSKNPTTSSVAVNSCVQKSVVHGTAVSPNVTNAFEKESNIKSPLSDVKPLKVVDSADKKPSIEVIQQSECEIKKNENTIILNDANVACQSTDTADVPSNKKEISNSVLSDQLTGSNSPVVPKKIQLKRMLLGSDAKSWKKQMLLKAQSVPVNESVFMDSTNVSKKSENKSNFSQKSFGVNECPVSMKGNSFMIKNISQEYEPQITKNTAGEIITAENPNVCDIPDEAKDCQQMTNNPVCSSAGGLDLRRESEPQLSENAVAKIVTAEKQNVCDISDVANDCQQIVTNPICSTTSGLDITTRSRYENQSMTPTTPVTSESSENLLVPATKNPQFNPASSIVSVVAKSFATVSKSSISSSAGTDGDLSSARIFSNVGRSSVTIVNDLVTPIVEPKTPTALAARSTFRGPQIRQMNTPIPKYPPSVETSIQSKAVSNKPYFRSSRQQVPQVTSDNRPSIFKLASTTSVTSPSYISTSPPISVICSVSNPTVSADVPVSPAVISRISSKQSSSESREIPQQADGLYSAVKYSSYTGGTNNIQISNQMSTNQVNPKTVAPKPLKSILYKPPVPDATIQAVKHPEKKNDSQESVSLNTSCTDSIKQFPSDTIPDRRNTFEDLFPKTHNGLFPKRKLSNKNAKSNQRKRSFGTSLRQSRGRGAKRGGGSQRGRRKRRKRLPSISSDEDIIEELNATACSFKPKAESPVENSESAESGDEDSDGGLVSFMEQSEGQLDDFMRFELREEQRNNKEKIYLSDNQTLTENEKAFKSGYTRYVSSGNSEDHDEEDMIPLSLIAKPGEEIGDNKKTNADHNANDNIFIKMSREIAEENKKNCADFDPVIHELLYPPFNKPPHMVKTMTSQDKNDSNFIREQDSRNKKNGDTSIDDKKKVSPRSNFFEKVDIRSSATCDDDSPANEDLNNPESEKSDDAKNNKNEMVLNVSSTDKMKNGAEDQTHPSNIKETFIGQHCTERDQASSSFSESSDLTKGNSDTPNAIPYEAHQNPVQPILPTPPTSPKSVNSDDKSDKATETSCQQNISSGSDKPMRTENVQVNHRATVVKSPSRCTGTKELVTDQYHHESWINNNVCLSGNLIEAAAELAGVKTRTLIGGNFLPSKPTPQSAVECAEPVTPIRRDSNDQLENIQLHISPINTLNETFTSWHMPEAESCHGFLEVCMSVHPNSVYALRRIPYVKTTTIVTESTSSSANTMFVRGQPSFLGANEAGMELPTSSACATYIRLRDIISLLKIHYEALYSLVVRCDAGMFWPNAYAQKLFSFVYDPVCDTDGNMAKMTLRNVRSTKAQHFLGHMIILDKFLHCILPKFYHEGLGVLSCDVPKYVNVKIFKPISDIDKEVIKIFQKPYEYNSVLRGKDDRIKCKVMEKLKLPPDCNKNRKRSASNDSTDSVKRRKSCTPGLVGQVTSGTVPRVSTFAFSQPVACTTSNSIRPYCQVNVTNLSIINANVVQTQSSNIFSQNKMYGNGVNRPAQETFPGAVNTRPWFSPQFHPTFTCQSQSSKNIGTNTCYAQTLPKLVQSEDLTSSSLVMPTPVTNLNHCNRLPQFSKAFLRPSVFCKSVEHPVLSSTIEGTHEKPRMANAMGNFNVTSERVAHRVAPTTATSSSPDPEFALTSIFGMNDQRRGLTKSTYAVGGAETRVTPSNLLTTKEFLLNASKVISVQNTTNKDEDTANQISIATASEITLPTSETNNIESTATDVYSISSPSDTLQLTGEAISRRGRKKLLEIMTADADSESGHLSGVVSKLKSRVEEKVTDAKLKQKRKGVKQKRKK
ncbi:uncharacterized protein LOC120341995 isoform X4 [Styela clava]